MKVLKCLKTPHKQMANINHHVQTQGELFLIQKHAKVIASYAAVFDLKNSN